MADTKNYIASYIKEYVSENGWSILNCSFKLSDLQAIVNEDGWCKVKIGKRKEESEKGATHYSYEDDFVPQPNNLSTAKPKDDSGDLPF
jgi:hypothetical protein